MFVWGRSRFSDTQHCTTAEQDPTAVSPVRSLRTETGTGAETGDAAHYIHCIQELPDVDCHRDHLPHMYVERKKGVFGAKIFVYLPLY